MIFFISSFYLWFLENASEDFLLSLTFSTIDNNIYSFSFVKFDILWVGNTISLSNCNIDELFLSEWCKLNVNLYPLFLLCIPYIKKVHQGKIAITSIDLNHHLFILHFLNHKNSSQKLSKSFLFYVNPNPFRLFYILILFLGGGGQIWPQLILLIKYTRNVFWA